MECIAVHLYYLCYVEYTPFTETNRHEPVHVTYQKGKDDRVLEISRRKHFGLAHNQYKYIARMTTHK